MSTPSRLARLALSVAVALALAACASVAPPRPGPVAPTRFPDLPEDAAGAIVVADLRAGGELAPFPQCVDGRAICLDPPPYWFHAEVREVLAGAVPGHRLAVATTSHYGMDADALAAGPVLLWLRHHDGQVVMPRYAMARLQPRDDGALFLLPRRAPQVDWLPCGLEALAVPIDAAAFPARNAWPRDEDSPAQVAASGGWLRLTPRAVVPTRGIPLRAVAERLRGLAPEAALAGCPDG